MNYMYMHVYAYVYACVYMYMYVYRYPDNKVHGAHMGSIWGRQDPSGPHVGPMNFAIWVNYL